MKIAKTLSLPILLSLIFFSSTAFALERVELEKAIARNAQIETIDATAVVDAMIKFTQKSLKKGERVHFPGFGTFKAAQSIEFHPGKELTQILFPRHALNFWANAIIDGCIYDVPATGTHDFATLKFWMGELDRIIDPKEQMLLISDYPKERKSMQNYLSKRFEESFVYLEKVGLDKEQQAFWRPYIKASLAAVEIFAQELHGEINPDGTERKAQLIDSIAKDANLTKVEMNKAQLIDAIAKDADLTKAQAKKALDSFVKTTTGSLKKGDRVQIPGFGTFSPAKRAAERKRNPQTGEQIKIKTKKVVRFKAGSELASTIKMATGELLGHELTHVCQQRLAVCLERTGAEAYASGNDVAFKSNPDLHTVAHEAAHVVQQRSTTTTGRSKAKKWGRGMYNKAKGYAR